MRIVSQSLAVVASIASLMGPTAASAQGTTEKPPIRIVVPFGPATPTDVSARLIANGLSAQLGRVVTVDNRPGAGGNIAAAAVAAAPADGTTLLYTVNSVITINPLVYSKLRHDPMKDLVPVAAAARAGYMLVASNKSGIKSLDELVASAKANPAKINYVSPGVGTIPHICAELIQAAAGIKLFPVQYKSGTLVDLMAGEVEVGVEPMGQAQVQVKAGKIAGLAVTTTDRVEGLSNIPALAESLPGVQCYGWTALMAPAKTPLPFRKEVEAAMLKIVASKEFGDAVKELVFTPYPVGAEQTQKLLHEDYARWAQTLKSLDIKLD